MKYRREDFVQSIHPLQKWPRGRCCVALWPFSEEFHDYLKDVFGTGIDPCRYRTLGGLSSALFRGFFVRGSLTQENVRVRRLALECRRGGRVENLVQGRRKAIWEWDRKQYYASLASTLLLPADARDWHWMESGEGVERNDMGFAWATWRFPKSLSGAACLPFVLGRKVTYAPVGYGACTLSEIALARSIGAEVIILEGWRADGKDQSLASYSAWILAEAQRIPEFRQYLKPMGNMLIGKFAQAKLKEVMAEDVVVATQYDHGSVWMPEIFGTITGIGRSRIWGDARQVAACRVEVDALLLLETLETEERREYLIAEGYRRRRYFSEVELKGKKLLGEGVEYGKRD
jgi:hypothetical protein